MYDVITVGSSTVDVFAKTKFSELIKIFDNKGEKDFLAYPAGAKILIDDLEFTTGGGATNTAVCFARLGHKVACVSKGGCGANMDKIIKHLKRDNVDSSLMVCTKNGKTGYSIILDSLEHDRTVLAFKGSNNELRFSELKLGKLKTKWFYFSTLLGESFKTLEKLAKFAEKKKIKMAFNTSEYLAAKGAGFLRDILSRTAIFVLNKEEAYLITKEKNTENALKKLLSFGPKIVAVTDGKNPVFVSDGKYIYSARPHNVKVVETTGAGDAFAASFLSGIIKRNDIKFAIELGITNSQSVIQHHGAKNKLLSYSEALEILKKNPIKITKRKLK